MTRMVLLLASHGLALGLGFALGIYMLPILTAPRAPTAAEIRSQADGARYSGEFRRDLKGSDFLHWGEGQVTVSAAAVTLTGKLAPGPDYKLYLSPEFVETAEDFLRLKGHMVRAGEVKTFENFIVPLPPGVDVERYRAVVVWCESFGKFISAARYR